MKSKILFLLSIVLFFTCSCRGNHHKDASQMIKDFYVSYASNVANGFDVKNDTLLTENMTPELIAKVHSIRAEALYDPIIRAQDFDLNDVKSFDVKPLEDGWYLVSYLWNSDEKKRTEIPVKATVVNGKLLIDDITPE